MDYTITKEGELIVVRFVSEPNAELLRKAILESEGFSTPLALWDLTYWRLQLAAEQLQRLADLAKSKRHRPARTAIVADQDLSYGLSRLYAAYRKQDDNEIQVFREEAAARSWLLSDG